MRSKKSDHIKLDTDIQNDDAIALEAFVFLYTIFTYHRYTISFSREFKIAVLHSFNNFECDSDAPYLERLSTLSK